MSTWSMMVNDGQRCSASKLSSITNFFIYISGNLIERVSEFMYLGVVMGEVLSWNTHVKYVLGKAGNRVSMFSGIRCSVTTNTANILPVLDYCDRVWNSSQRAALLIIRHNSSDEALKYLRDIGK